MSAPTTFHDLGEIVSRLQCLQNELARAAAEIANIAEYCTIVRTTGSGEQSLGEVLTPTQAAKMLGRSRSWVHQQVQRGVLPSVRLGSRVWLRRADLITSGWVSGSDSAARSGEDRAAEEAR